MKTRLFVAVLAAFSFTACEKTALELPNTTPIQEIAPDNNEPAPPENAAKWIQSHYPNYTVSKTIITRVREEVFYQFSIKQDAPELDKKIIIFDSNGDFVRMLQL